MKGRICLNEKGKEERIQEAKRKNIKEIICQNTEEKEKDKELMQIK